MKKIIFIVDDNDANLVMASSALENEFKVLTMPSAQKMFSLLEKMKADLILLDIEMPGMTGIEAIIILKNKPEWKDIPVIFLTGRQDKEFISDIEEAKALDIVFKPVDAAVLMECIKKHIK
jgi:putative two-component system response regulator